MLKSLAGGPPGGWLPFKRDGGVRQKFWKELPSGTEIPLCGRGLIFFHPLEVLILKEHLIFCHKDFRLNTRKGTTKVPAVELLEPNTLRGSKIDFLIPKRYDENPHSF